MKKELLIKKNKIAYALRKSKRARYMRLSVRRDLSVTVTLPWYSSENAAAEFIRERHDWILKKIEHFKSGKSRIAEPNGCDYALHKDAARKIVEEKLTHFNRFYGFSWNQISIRNPLSRWGSCSEKGNLNFSYRLVFLPEKLQDYIVVHELCHLGEFNHGLAFWNLMARTIPDHSERRKNIRSM